MEESAERVGRYRYAIVGVIWLVMFLGGLDRALISLLLADEPFLRDMGLAGNPQGQGLLMTVLLLPYAFANILLGPLADRWGPRRVLAGMAGVWAVAAAWMGGAGSFLAMLAGRALRGTAEGPLFPTANRLTKYWFPPRERGRANGFWLTGQPLGVALGVPLLALAIAVFGWRAAFFLQAGALVLLALPVVWGFGADAPALSSRVGLAERKFIASRTPAEAGVSSGRQAGLRALLTNYRYWLMVFNHLAMMAAYVGLATWLPKYLHEERGFDLTEMALLSSLPFLCSTAATLLFGFVSDRFSRRAVLCAGGLGGASAGIFLAALAPDPLLSALLVAAGFGFWGIAMPSYYAISQRIIPGPIVATGTGVDNGLANLGGAAAPVVVGALIAATGTYFAGLTLLAALGFLGALAMGVLAGQNY